MRIVMVFLLLMVMFISGCAATESAIRAMEESRVETEQLSRRVKELAYEGAILTNQIIQAEREIKAAVERGDIDAAEKWRERAELARIAFNKIEAEADKAQEAYERSVRLFEGTIERYKDAKSQSEAIGSVVGTVIQAALAAFGIGGVSSALGLFLRARRREEESDDIISETTRVIEKLKTGTNPSAEWEALKREMHDRLTESELKKIDELRP